MGKSLIIKNVSFFLNGILEKELLLDFDSAKALIDGVFNSTVLTNTIFFINGKYSNKKLNGIYLYTKGTGIISLYKATVDINMDFSNVKNIGELNIERASEEYTNYNFEQPILLGENEILGFSINTNFIYMVGSSYNSDKKYGTPQVLIGAGSPSSINESGKFQLNNAMFCNLY